MLEGNYCSISPIITKFILKHWPPRGNMFIKYGLCMLSLGKIKILHYKNSRITRTRGSVMSIRNALVQRSFPGNVSIVWKEYISPGESSRNVLYEGRFEIRDVFKFLCSRSQLVTISNVIHFWCTYVWSDVESILSRLVCLWPHVRYTIHSRGSY